LPRSRYRQAPSLIAESLRPIVEEVLQTAAFDDWSAVAGQLVADAPLAESREHVAAQCPGWRRRVRHRGRASLLVRKGRRAVGAPPAAPGDGAGARHL